MSEPLVLMKSKRWRRAEGLLTIAVPAMVALLSRLLARGPSLVGTLAVFFSHFLVPVLSNAVAVRFGAGEWMSADDRNRRLLDGLLSIGPARLFLWQWLAYFSWLLSVFAAMVAFRDGWLVATLAAIAVVTAAIAAFMTTLGIRRGSRTLKAAQDEQWPQDTLREWLPRYLLIHYICLGTAIVAGYFAGRYAGPPRGMFVFLGFFLLGFLLEVPLRTRFLARKRRQVLWTQIGFAVAVGLGLIQIGIPLGAAFALLPVLDGYPNIFSSILFGGGGLVFGTLVVVMLWTVARLGHLGPRNRAAEP